MLQRWASPIRTLITARRTYCKERECKPQSSCSKFNTHFINDFDRSECREKITIVGTGKVGIATCAFLLNQCLVKHLVMMDINEKWVCAEALDFLHASCLLGNPKIEVCNDGSRTCGSKYIIITAGVRPTGKKTRLDVAHDTMNIMYEVVPNLVKRSPDAVYVIASNPSDVMTWAVQKISCLPPERCISSGCHLDSMRFRYFIGKRLGMAPSEVDAFIIGEHGDHSVPVWSGVTIGGIPLMRILPTIGTKRDRENWSKIHKEVILAAYNVSSVKGYTSWAVAMALTDIIKAMIDNSGRILSVGTDVSGLMCIRDSVVLSLPCVLGSSGIRQILELPLTDFEKSSLNRCVKVLVKAQHGLGIGAQK